MIINELDKPLTAEDARKISLNNRDDSIDRSRFRDIMKGIGEAASFGYTRYVIFPNTKDKMPSDHLHSILKSFGYRVVEKRAYLWDEEKKAYSDKPFLSHDGREQFIVEITWG